MIYNNLNRVKGILSARLGTEIPKFLNGEKIYKKLLDGNEVFSYDGEGWFYVNNPSEQFTMSESSNFRNIPHYDEEQRLIYKRIEVSNNGGQHFLSEQYEIPGGLEATPYTSVKEAAKFNLQVNTLRTQDTIANMSEEQAPKKISNVDGELKKAVSLNVPPVDTTELSSGIRKLLEEKLNELSTPDNKNLPNVVLGISSGIQIVGNAFGLLLAATDSNTTKNITAVYDGIALTASNFGPWGQAASAIMGMAEGAGNIIQAITGGNDLMTKTDLWMSSPLLSWNAGIINDIGAKKSDDFGVDLNIMALVGSSYGGTATDLQDAASKAGKKYGLFSTKARKQANASIALAKSKQNLLENIADDAMDQRLAVQSMGEQAGLAYSMMTSGGYNQKYTYAAKHGGLLEWNPGIELEWEPQVELNWELPTLKEGGNIDFVEELEWIPTFKKGRNLALLIRYAKKENPRFIQRLSEKRKGIDFIDENGNVVNGSHLLSFSTDDSGAVVFPRIQEMEDGSLKYFSNWKEAWTRAIANNNVLHMTPEEAKLFTESGEDENGDLFGYKAGWPEFFFPEDLSEYPEEYRKFKMSLPRNQKFTPESEYRTYLYWQLWGKPRDFNYTKTHPSKDGVYMYNWDESDESYHASSVAWGDGVGYFMKPKHHATVGYELDWYNKGLITEEGGKQREMTPEERKEWEEFRSKYELVDDGDFYKYIPKNKKGGSLGDSDIPETEETTQKNVIPEGALHKNKHHMEHAEGLTKKGIPVVDEDGEQQAEIEHSEIIFTLEVTKKLEEYYEIFYSEDSTNKEKEQAALDAGKLLVYQILENTEDRTGLIESCKKGGALTLKKSTDDLIEEVLEWMPTVVIVETEEEPKKESKKEESEVSKKDTKEEIKEMIREVLVELLVK